MPDTIKLTIDGKEIEVEKGTTVLQAAERLGISVPRYCYHPGLTIAGNCRICVVDIEKFPKLTTSCTTQAADGMVVSTASEKVLDGRRAVMEFLLANHPLDCPICDQAGECRLQEYSYEHGSGGARFDEEKMKGYKQERLGPHVYLDTERCIVCTRCIRFCDEVSGSGELGVFQRGVRSYISTFPGRELDNNYSGNTVDICPVGALTLKEFRFKKRVWELRDVSSICGSCARGCNVNLGTASNRIWRLTPRENQDVNKWWMCDEGRMSYSALYATPRLLDAQVRDADIVTETEWPRALDLLAGRLKESRPQSVAAVASASMTVEDLYVLRRFFDEVLGTRNIIIPEHRRGKDDEILIRADKTPNAAGSRLLDLPVDEDNRQLLDLMTRAREGKVDAILLLGERVEGLEAARQNTFICTFTPFKDATVEHADLALPAAAYGEREGTWVNFQGHAQRLRAGITPPGVALEGWQIISELMRRMGVDISYSSSAEVLEEVAAKVPAFEGVSARKLGTLGVKL